MGGVTSHEPQALRVGEPRNENHGEQRPRWLQRGGAVSCTAGGLKQCQPGKARWIIFLFRICSTFWCKEENIFNAKSVLKQNTQPQSPCSCWKGVRKYGVLEIVPAEMD